MMWNRIFPVSLSEIRRNHRMLSRQPANFCRCRYFATKTRKEMVDYFITTPIFYVNASPHIGHLYTALIADFLSRYKQLKGENSLFTTGTDEHGLKIQQAAAINGKNPTEFCDEVSERFKELFKISNIEYTDFIRTTEDRHKAAVRKFWSTLDDRGYVYKGSYEGWYSVSDEAFLSESEVRDSVQDGKTCKVSVTSGQSVHWMKEKNYMFRLSQFKQRLHDWLDTGVIVGGKFERESRQMIEKVEDLSVSRQSDRLSWGIPVPSDPSQTIYVWLDALVNYLTVAGYPGRLSRWPPDCQVIGKDILRFHAVYWPAFLMAADLAPPTRLLCHSHWTVDNTKMSKSLGNVVNPVDRMNQYSVDGLRYFLLRVGVPHSDGNYSDVKAVECINSELVNVLGNLLSRCTSTSINKQQVFPGCSEEDVDKVLSPDDRDTFYRLQQLPDTVGECFEDFAIHHGLEKIVHSLHWANAFIEHKKPWQLVKDEQSLDELDVVLHVTMVTLRNCGILLQPVVPTIAGRLLDRLNVDRSCRGWDEARHLGFRVETGRLGGDSAVLLQRIKL